MRAVAVLGVISFHEVLVQPRMGLRHITTGGGLGVDIFFAISGFLITTLLLQEVRDRGAVRFGAFYLRRARRLLPALFVVLGVLAIASLFDDGHHRAMLLARVAAALFYAANFVEALSHFNMQQLGHTWTLAMEEQFYLVWPALLTAVVLLSKRRPRVVAVVIAVIAAVSVAWTQVALTLHWTFARAYYGPDTRAAGLALGAMLAALWTAGLLPGGRAWTVARRVGAALGVVFIALEFHDDKFSQHLGTNLGLPSARGRFAVFALMSVATVLIMWELLESRPHLGHRVLSWKPLAGIGRISYGLYLWDSPVVFGLTPAIVGLHGWSLIGVHLAALAAVAVTSWFVVERRFLAPRRTVGPAPPTPPEPGAGGAPRRVRPLVATRLR